MLKIAWELVGFLVLTLVLSGCAQNEPGRNGNVPGAGMASDILVLPKLDAIDLAGNKLQVIATTSIIGDIVRQVGGDAIDLMTLIGPGQDPHSYEPAAGDLAEVAKSQLIFVNGWDLEEGLVGDLKNIAPEAFIVPVSAGIEPIYAERSPAAEANSVDPHTWLDPHLVRNWVANISETLVKTDPDQAAIYEARASAYLVELDELIAYYDQQVSTIPGDQRRLVTNHDSFGYFAKAYGFEIAGVVIPAASTLAEPSSEDLVQLVNQMEETRVCTIFTDTTSRSQLAKTVTAELKNCPAVHVIPLYTGALGPAGSTGDSYLGMMKANIDAIVTGLA